MFDGLDRLLDKLPEHFDVDKYQIIFVPEIGTSDSNSSVLHQTVDAISFQKALRAQNIPCAGPVEMSLETEYLDRQSTDIWLGAYWILEKVAIPFVIPVLVHLFLEAIHKPRKEDVAKATKVIHTTLYFERQNVSKVDFEGDPATLIAIMKAIGGMDAENRS